MKKEENWTRCSPEKDGWYWFKGACADSYIRIVFVENKVCHDDYYIQSFPALLSCKKCKTFPVERMNGFWNGPFFPPKINIIK